MLQSEHWPDCAFASVKDKQNYDLDQNISNKKAARPFINKPQTMGDLIWKVRCILSCQLLQ